MKSVTAAAPKRIALYLRYSTDLQSETSIEDQERLCRAFAGRQGWPDPALVFADRAISGANRVNRPGYLAMMDAMQAGKFDALLVENMSRLTRDVETSAYTMNRAEYLRVRIFAANEGGAALSSEMANLQAMMAEMTRKQGAQMIHRGMSGLVYAGKSAGGRSYGYRSKPRRPGERGGDLEIVEDEALIVREIFRLYAEGKTPREIAIGLNARAVPAPRGDVWRANSLVGNVERGTGLLRNRLYQGVRAWNRTKMRKNPDSAKRVSQINDKDDWIVEEAPDLRIVETALWDAVQARLEERSTDRPETRVKPKRVLSGILKCGSCGNGLNSKGKDKTGRIRVRCSGDKECGVCPDPIETYLDVIENTVLNSLRTQVADPRRLQLFVDEYVAERRRIAMQTVSDYDGIKRKADKLQAAMDRARAMMMKGIVSEADFERDYPPMRTELESLRARLATVEEPSNVISIHPRAAERYKQAIENLSSAFGQDDVSTQLIRTVVSRVVVSHSDAPRANAFTARELIIKVFGGLDSLVVANGAVTVLPVGGQVGSGGGT